MKTSVSAGLMIVLALLFSSSALGQGRQPSSGGGGNTGGGGGGTSGGGSSSSSGLFGARSFGQGVTSRSGGFTGRGGQGGSAAGTTTRNDNAGEIQGNERFLRENRQQQGFIGQNANNTNNVLSQLAGGRQNQGNADQGRRGLQERTDVNQDNNNNTVDRRRTYRVGRDIAFDYPQPAAPDLSTTLAKRFSVTPNLKVNGPIEVTVENQTAILRGAVASQHDRALAEKLVLLEAGISRVRNELTVASSAAAATPKTPATP